MASLLRFVNNSVTQKSKRVLSLLSKTDQKIIFAGNNVRTVHKAYTTENGDFFGVNQENVDDEHDDHSSGSNEDRLSRSDLVHFETLINKYARKPKPQNVVEKSYGSVRYDHSKPELRKMSNHVCDKKQLHSNSTSLNTRVTQTFVYLDETEPVKEKTEKRETISEGKPHIAQNNENDNSVRLNNKLSYFDQQYFGKYIQERYDNYSKDHKLESVSSDDTVLNELVEVEEGMNYIDQQCFNHDQQILSRQNLYPVKPERSSSITHLQTEQEQSDLSFIDEQYFTLQNKRQRQTGLRGLPPKQVLHDKRHFEISEDDIHGTHILQRREHENSCNKSNDSNNKSLSVEKNKLLVERKHTVYDASMKIKKKFEIETGNNLVGKFDPKEFDSTGHRILRNQVPHFDNVSSVDVVRVLRKSIIYDQNDIVAISKPYGLPSHDGPGVVHSVGALLDQLIPKTQLFPVHRLDKETTGVMLFARTEDMANRLSESFLNREVTKRYLVITKNIPQMMSGEIDIPIAEGTVQGKTRMCLRPYKCPELTGIMKGSQEGTEAVTRYKVLDMGKKCAVLECMPVTGKKHQIRVHLAFGLNCPILGDHKYAHLNKLAPMRLHPEILNLLQIQQSKVRHLAMHLHARSVTIPEFFSGRNLFISAPLPPHFVRNLKDLKLKLPPNT